MMDIVNTADFQSQLTSVMEVLAKAAVVEIGKLFEENYSLLGSEISRYANENDSMRKKCVFLETELQAARRNASRMNETEASFSDGLTDTGYHPAIDNVFGKGWCMDLWRQEESNIGQNEDTNLSSSVNTVETVNMLDEKPDTILIKDETFEDCPRPAVGSNDERCEAESSADLITYTIPTDDQVKSNIQRRRAKKKKTPKTRLSSHGGSPTQPHLKTDELVSTYSSSVKFSSTQNQTSGDETDCVLCGRTFHKQSYLKVHMRIHTGEKPFVCTVCGKQFAHKTYLTTHQRTHSGERPYTCMDCGKRFSQKCSLNAHLRWHTGEKPYSCVKCGKSYTDKRSIKKHQCNS